MNAVGSKNKNTWGSWDKYPGSVDCPAAKLDEVYQFLNGKRSLRVGKYSEAVMDLTGGFKWYYYKGSYFSGINSFSGKTPTNQGDNVTDFSNKHKATGGHLRNDGNENNYAVKWEGFFVPKKTGSHKFWTESDDMSYLTINNVVVVDNGGLHGMVKAPKNELNPPESSRNYSTVYSNQAPGVGHARSMLDSDQAWSAAHNVVDQWMEIDMGAKNFIAGVVVQGRKGSTQRVTSFDVSIDGKTITSTLKYTSSKDTRQTYTFSNPVIGRKVRFRVKGWNSHASMRAGVIPAKSVNLKAGQKYPIKIYFSEKGGGDELKVWFQGPGMSSAIHDFSGYMVNDNTVGIVSQPSLFLRDENTSARNNGTGNISGLQIHDVDCGSDALNGFELIHKDSNNDVFYNFSCLQPLNLTSINENKTTKNFRGPKSGKPALASVQYLDRHDVDCGSSKPITQFVLSKYDSRNIQYKYKCGDIPFSDVTCRNTSTPWNTLSKSVHSLDNHNPKCKSDEYISKFKLNNNGQGKYRYDYKCCKKK